MNKTLFVRNQKTNEKQSKAPTEKRETSKFTLSCDSKTSSDQKTHTKKTSINVSFSQLIYSFETAIVLFAPMKRATVAADSNQQLPDNNLIT